MDKQRTYVYPWNMNSHGSKAISTALGIRRIRTEGSNFKGSETCTVINWGASELPDEVLRCKVINNPQAVKTAANKLQFFNNMSGNMFNSGPRIPEYTGSTAEAIEWVKEGKTVLARTKLNASSGKGIVFIDDLSEFLQAQLYTVYKKKKEEYRIHYAFGEAVCSQRKVLRKVDDLGNEINPKTIDFRIRNLKNGFVFQRHNIAPPQDVFDQAKKAFVASSLNFGAIDVIWNETEALAYVLEANCAPGLEASTISDYTKAFEENL